MGDTVGRKRRTAVAAADRTAGTVAPDLRHPLCGRQGATGHSPRHDATGPVAGAERVGRRAHRTDGAAGTARGTLGETFFSDGAAAQGRRRVYRQFQDAQATLPLLLRRRQLVPALQPSAPRPADGKGLGTADSIGEEYAAVRLRQILSGLADAGLGHPGDTGCYPRAPERDDALGRPGAGGRRGRLCLRTIGGT